MHGTLLIAIGANLESSTGRTPLQTCQWAVLQLAALPELRLVAQSRWYRSAPVPPSGQPDYVNGVVRLSGAAEPHRLLASLHAIEAEAGRVRGEANAARTLDLDLLAVDELMIASATLTLPHPRMHARAFVLAPLVEVAPDWVHPRLKRNVAELLAAADQTGLTVRD